MKVQSSFDRDRQAWKVGVADDLAELLLGFEHPGGGPPQPHLAGGPVLDVALCGADGVDHRLGRVGGLERAAELAADPELDHRERLVHPFPKRAGGAGMRVVELVGEPGELLERALIVGLAPRPAEPGLDRWAVALGEVLHDVSFFVP